MGAPRSPYTLLAADLLTPDLAEILASEIDRRANLLVISLHVTGPASYLPRPELVAAVDAAVAHGADIIVAHGTHVIGPVERRGNTVIAWGLGNLFFDCECTTEDEALILRVSLAPGHAAEIIPIRAGLGGPSRGSGYCHCDCSNRNGNTLTPLSSKPRQNAQSPEARTRTRATVAAPRRPPCCCSPPRSPSPLRRPRS